MSAAQPLAWVLGVLAVPLVAAYFHRRKRRVKQVSSTVLYRAIAGQNTPTRTSLARPRHLLSLLLMLLALAGLVAALSDLRDDQNAPRDYVVVLDTSASMGATETGSTQTRLQEAVDALADGVGAMGPGDRVALLATGGKTRVLIGLTEDHAAVLELARAQQPAGANAATVQTLRIADAMAQGPRAGVILLSDGVGVSVPDLQRMPQLVAVGRPGDNLGINALTVREADALGLSEIYVSVSSNVSEEREVEIALRVDDAIVDVLPLTVPASGQRDHLHRLHLPDGEQVVASLQDHGTDVLAADDVAVAPRRSGERVEVLLVATSRRSFTAEALRLHPRVDLTTVGPFDAIPSPTRAAAWDLVVLEAVPRDEALPPARHVLALGVEAEAVGLQSGTRVASPEILRWTFEHPLFRFVDLGAIDLPRATTVGPASDATSLVDSEQGPLATLHRHQDAQVVYFGFAPQESDLVLRVGFVNLMANVVEWAAPEPSAAQPPATQGDTAEAAQNPAAAPRGVLPQTETLLDPPDAIPGTHRGDFAERPVTEEPLWHWLVWLAAALVAIEGLVPLTSIGTSRLRATLAARRNREGRS